MSATTSAPPSGRTHPARQRALEPYLEKLRGWGSSDVGKSARINVGDTTLVLEPWERGFLSRYLAGEVNEETESAAHGIALLVKCTFDVAKLTRTEALAAETLYALQAELMLDTAIGTALLHELQGGIDRRVAAGKVEDAKACSRFRHQLTRAVAAARQRIAESEREQADTLARSLTATPFAPARPQAPPASVAPSVDEASAEEASPEDAPAPATVAAAVAEAFVDSSPQQARFKRRGRAQPAAPASAPTETPASFGRTRALALMLGVVGVLWLLTLHGPGLVRGAPAQAPDLSGIGESWLVSAAIRPPSVYVTASSAGWKALDPAERKSVLLELANRVETAGCSGVQLNDEQGRPLARWLKTRGAEEIRNGEEPPVEPPAPTRPAPVYVAPEDDFDASADSDG